MELTKEFLLQKAHQWDLTDEQEEVLVLKFGEEQSNQDISERLGISINACVQCLGEIYRKAGIIGRSRGKAHRLRSELLRDAGLTEEGHAASLPMRHSSARRKPGVKMITERERVGKANLQYPVDWRLEDWLEQIQQTSQDLSVNPDGEAVEEALQLLSELPTSTTALASESRLKRVEVIQKILQQVGKLFTTIAPSLDKFDGLIFLNPAANQLGNPIHRSIIAFIQRLNHQLKLDIDPLEIDEKVLQVVLREGHQLFQDIATRPSQDNPVLKTYPAWVRKTCLRILSDYSKSIPKGVPVTLLDSKNGIDRNLMAIDTSILEMYLNAQKDDFLDLNYFDILVARWMKNTPWRKKELDATPSDHEQSIILGIDPVDLEWASLSALRRRYHDLSRMKKYDFLSDYFIDSLKEVKEEYTDYFWISYDEIEISFKDDYKILSIPRSFLGHKSENLQQCEEFSQDVRQYCKLAAYDRLDAESFQALEALLEKACRYPILDFWFNEIDHFMDHCLAEVDRPTNGYSTGTMSRV